MEFSDVLTIIGMLVAGAGTLWAVTKYLIDRMDKKTDECHTRISAIKNTMTNRSDFDKHVEYMERQIDSVRDDIKTSHASFTSSLANLGNQLTNRLDNIMLALRKGAND